MLSPDFPLILASSSPSRKQLMEQLGIPFTHCSPDIDETPFPKEKALAYVQRMAQEKAQKISSLYPHHWILGADTIVSVGTKILQKAQSPQEAAQQMAQLSGRRHHNYTALTLMGPEQQKSEKIVQVTLAFKSLSSQEIENFVESQQWRNVAVYRHEGVAARFIRWIHGQPSSLGGLPLYEVWNWLKGKGLCK